MGWASGSAVAGPMIAAIKREVADEAARRRLYEVLHRELTAQDWDTVDEAHGIDPLFDEMFPAEDDE